MDIPTSSGQSTSRASHIPADEGQTPPPARRRHDPSLPPQAPAPNSAEGTVSTPANADRFTSAVRFRAGHDDIVHAPEGPPDTREQDDEIELDSVRLNMRSQLSPQSAMSSMMSEAPVSDAEIKKYLDTADLKNYLQYKALLKLSSDPEGIQKLKHILNRIIVSLPESSPSREKIRKLQGKIFKAIPKLEANHDVYLKLLAKRRSGGWRYLADLSHHLRSKDSTAQFAARAFLTAFVMGGTGMLMQFTFALIGMEACRTAAANRGAGNAAGNATATPVSSTPSDTDMGMVSSTIAPNNASVDADACELGDYIKSAFLPKDASPGTAMGVDMGIRIFAGTIGGTLDGRNEIRLQEQNRARGRNNPARITGQTSNSTWYGRAYASGIQSAQTHFFTSTVGALFELGTGMATNGKITAANLGRAALVHYSGAVMHTTLDAGRDAAFPNASDTWRFWGKAAARMAVIPIVRQAIRSAVDGQDKYGYLSNIFAYGILIGATHEIEIALFHSLRDKHTPPDEKEQNQIADLIVLLGKLGVELEDERVLKDHEELPDTSARYVTDENGDPTELRDLVQRATDTIKPCFTELIKISDMLPGSPELQEAATELDQSLPKSKPGPSFVTAAWQRCFGKRERERDIEMGAVREDGEIAATHSTVETLAERERERDCHTATVANNQNGQNAGSHLVTQAQIEHEPEHDTAMGVSDEEHEDAAAHSSSSDLPVARL